MNTSFKIVAYIAEWNLSEIHNIPFSQITHLNYAFAYPKENGTIHPFPKQEQISDLVKLAHKHDVKILLSVGGWSYKGRTLAPIFQEATNTEAKRKTLAKNISDLVMQFDFDGADIDWEYPYVSTGASLQYEDFLLKLSAMLKAKNRLLTGALLAGVDPDDRRNAPDPEGFSIEDGALGHTNKALSCYDYMNIMSYDGGDGLLHSSYEFGIKSAQYWANTRGIDPVKLNLGIPFYGRPGWFVYKDLCHNANMNPKEDTFMVDGMMTYYNGINTVKQKTAYAKKHLGGVMVWEITQDSPIKEKSLMNAIFLESQNQE